MSSTFRYLFKDEVAARRRERDERHRRHDLTLKACKLSTSR